MKSASNFEEHGAKIPEIAKKLVKDATKSCLENLPFRKILAMLPPGWTEKYSETHANPCYVHAASGTTIWTRPTSSSVEQQGILTFLASPFSPVTDVSEEDAGKKYKTATVKSKRKKEEETDMPKEKQVRTNSLLSPVTDMSEEDAGKKCKTATVKSKRKKEEETDMPKEKQVRTNSLLSPVTDMSEEDASKNSKTATVKSKRKKEEETDMPKEKKARTKYPKTPSASALVVNSDMVAVDKTLGAFVGATIYALGGGCAVLTFVDPVVQKLLPAAVDFVSRDEVLEYDREFTIFSKICTRRRGEGFFSDTIGGYSFSKDKLVAQPLHPTLRALLDHANTFVPHDKFTAITTNRYRNDNDGIGDHTDKDVGDEEQIGVLAFSHGASRVLSFRPIDRSNGELKELHVATENGQTLVMYGKGFQTKFTHGIKAKKTKKSADGAGSASTSVPLTEDVRVSFTFRRHHREYPRVVMNV